MKETVSAKRARRILWSWGSRWNLLALIPFYILVFPYLYGIGSLKTTLLIGLVSCSCACVACIFQPVNPFGENMFVQKRIDELSEEERKVLSFFKGKQYKKICVATCLANGIILLLPVIANIIIPPPNNVYFIRIRELGAPGIIFGIIFLHFFVVLYSQMCAVYTYILKHWDKIQSEEIPWPKDQPFANNYWSKVLDRENKLTSGKTSAHK